MDSKQLALETNRFCTGRLQRLFFNKKMNPWAVFNTFYKNERKIEKNSFLLYILGIWIMNRININLSFYFTEMLLTSIIIYP